MVILKQLLVIFLLVPVLYGCGDAAIEASPEAASGVNQPGSSDFTAIPGNEFVLLTWPDTEVTTSYDLYWSLDQNVPTDSASLIGNIAPPFIHKNLSSNTTYYYQLVSSINGGGSTRSNIVSSNLPALDAPILSAETGNGTVTLTWDDQQQDNKLYTLFYYNASNINTEVTFQINSVVSPFAHQFLKNDLPYYYILTITDQNGTSASDVVVATPRIGTQVSSISFYECFDLEAGIAVGVANISTCPDNADYYFAYGGGAPPNAAIFQNQCIGPQCQQSTEIAITDILYADFTYANITSLTFTTNLLSGRFDRVTVIKTVDGNYFKLGPISEMNDTTVNFQWERLYLQ